MLRSPRGVVAVAAAFVLAGALPVRAETLKIDPNHTHIGFRIRHLFTKVDGRFRQFEGTIDLDEKNLADSRVSVTIQAASIDTNVEPRDKDLRSKRFFDVEQYPTITFTSTAVIDVAGDKGKIKGNLTMHGVTREVVIDAEALGKGKDPYGNLRWGFHGATTLNRKDYGLTWNEVLEGGGVLVGDDVEIELDVEALQPPPGK